jgi:hypothetical protein
MMLKCVDCGYEGSEFSAAIDGLSQGAFTYIAKCTKCNSRKVKHIQGYFENDHFESDLRISIVEQRTRTSPSKVN